MRRYWIADAELKRCGMSVPRKLGSPLKPYLLDARLNGRPLEGARLDLVEKFANTYEHARHDPSVRHLLNYSMSVIPLKVAYTYVWKFSVQRVEMPKVACSWWRSMLVKYCVVPEWKMTCIFRTSCRSYWTCLVLSIRNWHFWQHNCSGTGL